MFRAISRILLIFLYFSFCLSLLPSVFADIRDLYPNYPYHSSPFTHREMYDYFTQPPAGTYSSISYPEYQRPSRHGVRYYRVNLETGAETEIISNGYDIYYERSGTQEGWLLVSISISIQNTIEFADNEGFGLRFWVAIQDSSGVWHYSMLGNLELLYVNNEMQYIERINPCSPTQYILTYRDTIESPPRTTAYSYWFYPSSMEMHQSRLLSIDIDYGITKEWHDIATWTFNLASRKWFNVASWNFNISTLQWHDVSVWSFNLASKAWQDIASWSFNLLTKEWREIAVWSFNLLTKTWNNIAQWTFQLATRTWHNIAEWSFNLITHGWHTITHWILTVSTTNIPTLFIGIIFTACILFLVIGLALKKRS